MAHRLLAFIAAFFLSAPAHAGAPVWKVSQFSGDVRLVEAGRERRAERGALLSTGSAIVTGAGSRAVIVRDREYIVVSARTRLRLPGRGEGGGLIKIIADYGAALFKVDRKTSPHFGVRTPYLAAVVKGTTFRVTVGASGARVAVREGAVAVTTSDGKESGLVTAGSTARVAASAPGDLKVDASGAQASSEAAEEGVLQAAMRREAAANDPLARAAGGLSIDPAALLRWLALLGGLILTLLLAARLWPDGRAAAAVRRSRRGLVSVRSEERAVQRAAPVAEPKPATYEAWVPPVPASERDVAMTHDPAATPAPDDGPARRQHKRSRVLLSVTIGQGDKHIVAKLRDISRTGAVAECEARFEIGSDVSFTSGAIATRAEVLWASDGRYGLRFPAPIDEADLLIHIGKGRPRRRGAA